jgi:prepilin-type N-terminal cleavage/methylation domain-containing protein/prepilin-type processing-associated H-X9-DG protein
VLGKVSLRHPPPRTGTAPRAQSAFTLIELLVVIAIIAILAAILFPVFAQARGKARQVACLNNTKQIATAIYMYVQDYDETLPYEIQRNITTWDEALYPYTKNVGVYVCPSDSIRAKGNNSDNPTSYFCNQAVLRSNTSGTTAPRSLAALDAPADTIAMAEVNYTPTASGGPGTGFRSYLLCTSGVPHTLATIMAPGSHAKMRIAYNRHNEGANYVFVDGHAKWHRLEQTVSPTWMHGPCN